MSKFIDITGKRFGKLIAMKRVEDYVDPHGYHSTRWLFQCDCGNQVFSSSANLRKSSLPSCRSCAYIRNGKNATIDLTGKIFGNLLVIKRDNDYISPSGIHKIQWLCECKKDKNRFVITGNNLTCSRNVSNLKCPICSQKQMNENKIIDLTGKVFGLLKVIKRTDYYISPKGNHKAQWICNCKCGNKGIIATSNHLISGRRTSCGCQKESWIASELKKYYVNNYFAIPEYKIIKNIETNRYLSYDIYIPDGIFIEIQGEQHYREVGYFHRTNNDFEYRKKLDKIKKQHAKKNGIYIEIDLRKIKTTEEAISYINKIIKGV